MGEVVTIWGGQVFTADEVQAGKARKGSLSAIAERLYLGVRADAPDELGPDHFLNHSCDPNTWMTDEVTLVARRDIAQDEELTADYAMWEADENHVMRWACACGSPLCRGRVTGQDWRLPELQQRYRGHFSPLINQRIARLQIGQGP
jgi:hypothetical protein